MLSIVEPYELPSENGRVQMGTRHDGNTGIVCLESDLTNFPKAIAELQHGAARQKAVEIAGQRGLPNPACGMPASPYPVDAQGLPVTRPTEQKIYRYHVDVPVTRRMT